MASIIAIETAILDALRAEFVSDAPTIEPLEDTEAALSRPPGPNGAVYVIYAGSTRSGAEWAVDNELALDTVSEFAVLVRHRNLRPYKDARIGLYDLMERVESALWGLEVAKDIYMYPGKDELMPEKFGWTLRQRWRCEYQDFGG